MQSIQRIKTPGAGREGNGMGKIKILLVDDEREEREGISWLIEKYQYPLEIMQASNGKEALQWIEKTKNVIQYASVAFQASNLFTWTHYKESDPESGSLVGTQQPVFTLKLSVSF